MPLQRGAMLPGNQCGRDVAKLLIDKALLCNLSLQLRGASLVLEIACVMILEPLGDVFKKK